jgi:hypothetical protein
MVGDLGGLVVGQPLYVHANSGRQGRVGCESLEWPKGISNETTQTEQKHMLTSAQTKTGSSD